MAKYANHFYSPTKPNEETMSSALGMNLMPPTSAFQHGGSLQQPPQPPATSQQPPENPTNNANASELNDTSKDNHGKQKTAF